MAMADTNAPPQRRMTRVFVTALAGLVAIALVATACSSSDDSQAGPPPPPAGFEHLADLVESTGIDTGELLELNSKLFERNGVTLTKAEEACALGKVAEDTNLLTGSLLVTDASELGFEGNASLAVALIDCAPDAFIQTSTVGADPMFADNVPECMVDVLDADNPARRDALVGLFALGNSLVVPVPQRPATVDLMNTCMSGTALAQVYAFGDTSNPFLVDALDTECVDDTFAGGRSRQLIEAIVAGSGNQLDIADDEVVATLGELYNCVSFTELFVAATAGSGIPISDETVACLEPRLQGLDMAEVLRTDISPPQVEEAFDECLTPEEADAVLGE